MNYIYQDQYGKEWFFVERNKITVKDGRYTVGKHQFTKNNQYFSMRSRIYYLTAVDKNFNLESFGDSLNNGMMASERLELTRTDKTTTLDEFLENKQTKKFAAVHTDNALFFTVCLNENNEVVPYAFEDCPMKGKIFNFYTKLDIDYETYCKLIQVKPQLEKIKSPQEQFSEFVNECNNGKFSQTLGCQKDNIVAILMQFNSMVNSAKKVPEEYRKIVTNVLNYAINPDKSTIYIESKDRKFSEFIFKVTEIMKNLWKDENNAT